MKGLTPSLERRADRQFESKASRAPPRITLTPRVVFNFVMLVGGESALTVPEVGLGFRPYRATLLRRNPRFGSQTTSFGPLFGRAQSATFG
jgi:hypothetical protein